MNKKNRCTRPGVRPSIVPRAAALACAAVLSLAFVSGTAQSASAMAAPVAAANQAASEGKYVKLSVLSSPANYVSGGDARIGIRAAPGLHDKLQLVLNGSRIAPQLQRTGSHSLEAVISGLHEGDNQLDVYVKGQSLRDSITLTNFPVTGPMFSGPQQTPFVCTTIQGAVGRQPLVDSASPPGYRVTDATGATIGYSRNCSIEAFVSYFYVTNSGSTRPLPAGGTRPADMGTVTLADGRVVDFVIRREIGSINRFLYSIAMLSPAPAADNASQNDTSLWNGRLLYWFQGGVAIGHSQGTVHGGSMNTDILRLGYAIVHSSGNNTGTHYNLELAGETAMMTKERFV